MADLQWLEFDASVFDRAQAAGKPILLVITKPWCPHSRRLLETTFATEHVATAVRDGFLLVRADAERRPDVNERYGTGSWPTIAYVTPEGELINNDGYLDADDLVQRLDRVRQMLAEDAGEIRTGLESLWGQDAAADAPGLHKGQLNREIIEDVTQAILDKFDHQYGGWGDASKFPHPEALDFALIQMAKGDQRMRTVALTTLDRMMEGGIHDAIDGGFFRFSKTPDWRNPNFEKVLDANAMRLRCYLEAYQLTENPAYARVSEGIVDWMLRFVRDDETGAFWGAQDADADYYLLDAAGRGNRQPPRVDTTIYTNWNAMAVSSLLKTAAVLDRADLRDVAMRALGFVLDNLVDDRDGVFHYWDGTYHLPGLLSDQAYLMRALIDAAQHTGDSDYLLPAERVAELAIERQRAPGGGFYDILNDSQQYGSMRRRNRSILENSVMAEALLRLSILSRRTEFHDEAVATLSAFTDDYKQYGYYVAGYGRAVDLLFYVPLSVFVVGKRDSDTAQELRRTALSTYVPSRIVQMLDPEKDPILLERSGFAVEDEPYCVLGLGLETRATARDPDALLQTMSELERERR